MRTATTLDHRPRGLCGDAAPRDPRRAAHPPVPRPRSALSQTLSWHEGGNLDGPPLIMLNGWNVLRLVWPNQLLQRLGVSYRLLAVDNRGTGMSRPTRWPFTMGDLAGDVHRAMGDVGVERATVVGFSMGGMIAQELALRWPAQVERLVLISTRPPSPCGSSGEPAVLDRVMASGPATPADYVANQRDPAGRHHGAGVRHRPPRHHRRVRSPPASATRPPPRRARPSPRRYRPRVRRRPARAPAHPDHHRPRRRRPADSAGATRRCPRTTGSNAVPAVFYRRRVAPLGGPRSRRAIEERGSADSRVSLMESV